MSDQTAPQDTGSQPQPAVQEPQTTAPPSSATESVNTSQQGAAAAEEEEDAMDVDVDDEMFDDNVDSLPQTNLTEKAKQNSKDEKEEGEGDSEDEANAEKNDKTIPPGISMPALPEFTKKDKTLHEILEMMEDFYPIIPDAITDYYLTKNGLQCDDMRIKRILALATQKFVSDIATDAYEYSRIRSQSTVYNSSNPQVRAKALMAGAVGGLTAGVSATGNTGNNSKKVVLTTEDLSSALSEYGLNVTRPDFYR
ncbi:hypothetical protein WICPIJ_009717 [Wickerhamomyces pijperi]|uniref:Transcription initiation factor TFIID subunit 10 n=1 Tax=Wickerhamomyces pijperi TaxID=599730 RepID=A0A9P8PL75_WICPI|nr:hypothetical protein WICPIJ_009717 [Wickerhamomyces pijperi]